MKQKPFESMSVEEMQSVKRCLELLGALRTYKRLVVVAHPRQASSELIELLERLRARDVEISAEPFSAYCPDHFFSIVLWRPQDEELAHDFLGWRVKGPVGNVNAGEDSRRSPRFCHDAESIH